MEMTPEELLAYNQQQSIELQDGKRWEILGWEVREILANEADELSSASEAIQLKYCNISKADADIRWNALADDNSSLWELVGEQHEYEYYEQTYYHPVTKAEKVIQQKRANPLFWG